MLLFIYLECLCVSVCVSSCCSTHLWRVEGDLLELVLSFHHQGPGDQPQIIRLWEAPLLANGPAPSPVATPLGTWPDESLKKQGKHTDTQKELGWVNMALR